MKNIIKLTAIALFGFCTATAFGEGDAKPEAPAKEEAKPKMVTMTGTLFKENDKIKFKSDAGKKYMVVKKQYDKVKDHVDKKVKLTCKTKSKEGKNGKPFHMVVYIKSVEPAAAE